MSATAQAPTSAGPATLAERKVAMETILRAMHTDGIAAVPSARPLNVPTALPVIGAAWDEQIHVHTVPVAGISILRNCVRKELDFLNRAATKQGDTAGSGGRDSSPDVAISSNAPFLEALWSCAQHYVRTAPPLTDLSTSVPVPVENSAGPSTSSAAPLKIDVVADGGQLWVRLFTLKPSSLLQEFRLVEAEEAEDSSDDEDELAPPPAATVQAATRGQKPFSFDEAARRSSIYRTALDMRKAADLAFPPSSTPDGSVKQVTIHLILTRLDRSATLPDTSGMRDLQMRNFPEEDRYKLRLNAILDELESIPNLKVFTSQKVPFSRITGCLAPTAQQFVPRDVKSTGDTIRQLNLDLSALVALTSDIVHGDALASDATLEQSRACFHAIAPYKIPNLPGSSSKPNVQTGAHGRALAEQLWRECCQSVENGGDFLNTLLRPFPGSSGDVESAPKVELWTTRESAEKFIEIVDLVAGEDEKRRALALFSQDQVSVSPEAFWTNSRWERTDIRDRLQLPVRILDDEPASERAWTDPITGQFTADLENIIVRTLRSQDEDLGPSIGERTRALAEAPTSGDDSAGTPSAQASSNAPTPHTLRSLLAGCAHGMTTLTTNFTSIKWLVRQSAVASSNKTGPGLPAGAQNASVYPTPPGSLGLIGKYYLATQRVASMSWPQAAVIWVLHPRSFAEQMRVTDMTQVAAAAAAAAVGSEQERSEGGTSLIVAPPRLARSGSEVNGCAADVSLPIHDQTEPPPPARQPGRRTKTLSVPSFRAIGQWVRGPSEPETLEIRHYPWWPFASVERTWLGLTSTVAWKDPRIYSPGAHERETPEPEHDVPAERGRLERLRERGRAKARAGIRNIKEGLPTWVRSPSQHRDESQIELSPGPSQRDPRAYRVNDAAGESRLPSRLHDFETQDSHKPHDLGSGTMGSDEAFGSGTYDTSGGKVRLLSTSVLLKRRARGTPATSTPDSTTDAAPERRQASPAPARDDFLESVWRDWRLNWLHWILLFVTCACWIVAFAVLAKSLWYQSSVFVPGSGGETANDVELTPVFYGCTATYWLGNAGCGLDGADCAPFTSDGPVAFRCPSGCLGTPLGNPRAVGDLLPAWVPLIVGGGDAERTYRADSWVCPAAAHAGIIDDRRGGCGALTLTGTFSGFVGAVRNGAESVGFNSTFPVSYRFGADGVAGQCTDRRSRLYVLDVILSAFVGFVLRPKPIVWFWILVCLGFWHVNFASEPRDFPPPVGAAFGDFLPTLFGSYAIWRLSFRFVWPHFQHVPLEREIWNLAAYWIGVLFNVVFANVPISRLVSRDLASQPGAITALVILIAVVAVLALNQVRVIRKTTFLPRYLSVYATGGVVVGLLAAIPTQTVRVHHYIISLVLLPGCAFATRLSLVYCAFLLGMFLNGLGRWGWDGVLQDEAVVIGDGTRGTGLPQILNSSTNWAGTGSNTSAPLLLTWAPLNSSDPAQEGYDAFNLLVDDVLRYSGAETSFDLSSLVDEFAAASAERIRSEAHYVRLAYASDAGATPGDFTRAAVAYFNGTFVDAPPGAT